MLGAGLLLLIEEEKEEEKVRMDFLEVVEVVMAAGFLIPVSASLGEVAAGTYREGRGRVRAEGE